MAGRFISFGTRTKAMMIASGSHSIRMFVTATLILVLTTLSMDLHAREAVPPSRTQRPTADFIQVQQDSPQFAQDFIQRARREEIDLVLREARVAKVDGNFTCGSGLVVLRVAREGHASGNEDPQAQIQNLVRNLRQNLGRAEVIYESLIQINDNKFQYYVVDLRRAAPPGSPSGQNLPVGLQHLANTLMSRSLEQGTAKFEALTCHPQLDGNRVSGSNQRP